MNKQKSGSKKFSSKEGSKEVLAPVDAPTNSGKPHAQAPKKTPEAPKLPVKMATKNDALKCLVVSDGSLTYFGTESREEGHKGEIQWRVVYSPDRVKTLFTKVEAIQADGALDDTAKAKKIAETYKSYTSPMSRGVQWTHKLETAIPTPAPVSEAPAA